MYICLYFMSQVWPMKFTELTNTFYVSVRVGCAIKVNDNGTFMENITNFYVANGL